MQQVTYSGSQPITCTCALTTHQTPTSRTCLAPCLQSLHHNAMAGKPSLQAGLASYQSFRPNVYHTSSSSRVSSDPSATNEEKSSHRHKSHRHHHHHDSQDRHTRHSSARRHAKEVVQSAIQLQPPTSFGDLLKQARGSKDTSPSHSRKGSIAPGTAERTAETKENENSGIIIPPRRPLRAEGVELERKRIEARER